jgi:AMMECR1 domain-containing protein
MMARSPLQRCEHYVPGLRSAPWWDPAEIPIVGALESNYADILQEFDDFVLAGSLMLHPQSAGGPRKNLADGDWSIVDLWSTSRLNEKNAVRAPVTASVLCGEPSLVNSDATLAYFSVVAPHSHVEAHCGPTNARIRVHLGLRVPAGGRIRVGRETRSWVAGRCLVFDDSWEHEVWNDAPTPRAVLLLDVAHPDLAEQFRAPRPRQPVGEGKPTREGWARQEEPRASPRAQGHRAAQLFRSVFALLGDENAAVIRRSLADLCGSRSHLLAAAATCAVNCELGGRDFDLEWHHVPALSEQLGRPWSGLLTALQTDVRTLPADDQVRVVQACATYWRSLPGNAAYSRAFLERWPAAQMRDLVRRLAAQANVPTMCEFLAAYETQNGAPPFGATAPLLVSVYRDLTRANRQLSRRGAPAAAAVQIGTGPIRTSPIRTSPIRTRPMVPPSRSPVTGSGRPAPGDLEVLRLFKLARRAIAQEVAGKGESQDPRRPVDQGCVVNVSIILRGELRASMSGQGATLGEAVTTGARRAAHDTRFGPMLRPEELAAATIEIWEQRGSEPMSPLAAITGFDLGAEGVTLWRGGRSAYYKPSVPLTGGVTDPARLFRQLAKKAGLEGDVWCYPGTTLQRTKWDHYLENPAYGAGLARLHRLRPVRTPEPTLAEIRARLDMACNRLVSSQLPSGLYLYKYNPFRRRSQGSEMNTAREKDAAREMNTVRQAGCTYAVAAAAARGPDEARRRALADSAAASVGFLLQFAEHPQGGQCRFMAPDDEMGRQGALGTVALTLLALQYEPLASTFADLRNVLTDTVVAAQEGDGCFRCDLVSTGTGHDSPRQDFYPGEALIALAHEAERGRTDCAEAVTRALGWYREHFHRAPATGFVLWQVDAWCRAHNLARNGAIKNLEPRVCADFVFEMVDWLLQFQLPPEAKPPDFAGGFFVDGPPGFSTSTYVEAVLRAYELARSLGKAARAQRYRSAAVRGLRFLFRLQIVPEMAPLFREPALAVGATTASLVDFHIRSDFDQHTITSLLAALECDGIMPNEIVAVGAPS